TEFRNDTLINSNTRDLTNTVDQKLFNASVFYTHKFKKTGRTFSLNVSEAYSQSKANGYLKSEIDFYSKQGQLDSAQKINELKTNDLQSQTASANATYTEPFSKALSLIVNYGLNINSSTADRQTFNQSAPGIYNDKVDSLSSDYKLNQLANQAGAALNYKKGKINFNFGTKVSDVSFREIDQFTGNPLDRNFIDWNPQARFQYRFSQQKSFSINYNGRTTQPTLDQIQPLRVNNDPLNIVLGNPDLTPSFSNNISVFYNSYKVISDQSLFFGGNYSFTSNPIISHVSYSGTGVSTSQYFNLSGKETSSFNLWGNANRKIQKIGINIGVNMDANGNVFYNYVNNALNMTKNYTFNPGINFGKYQEKKLDFNLSGGPTYTLSQSSLQPNINNNGWGARAYFNFNIYLPGKFQIGSNSEYQYTAKTQSFPTDFSRVLLNASVTKSFLKTDNLKVEIRANDLLNQNVGFSRDASANLITQNSYTTIKRYFMLAVTYDFSKMAGGAPKK
ncbi:MAG TPA: outer membrane beta-barrel protein, partial [Mucilaginibacter sp.]|nr:outer membrane beta-barrel protein [Mucilaginibacter sp.]